MQPDPHAERAEFPHQIDEFGAHPALAVEALRIAEIEAIGARILRNDEDFLDTRCGETLGLA